MSPRAPSDRWGKRSARLLGAFTVAVCIFLIIPILVVFLSSLTTVEYV
jgi:ABC-type spermidine/putrescine transport system permease subunit II